MNKKQYTMETIDDGRFGEKEYKFFIAGVDQSERSSSILNNFYRKDVAEQYIFLDLGEMSDAVTNDDYKEIVNSESSALLAGSTKEIWMDFDSIGIKPHDSVAIDITAFTIPEMFNLLFYLRQLVCIDVIDFFYTEPQNYYYEDGYFESFNKANAPIQYKPIPGFQASGSHEDEVLVLMIGFDQGLGEMISFFTDRSEDQEMLLKSTYIINGLPSYSIKSKDISLLNNFELISNLEKKQIIGAGANNPFFTYNTLVELHSSRREELFTICPICSKPMALGACIYALDNVGDVKVTYPFGDARRDLTNETAGISWRYTI